MYENPVRTFRECPYKIPAEGLTCPFNRVKKADVLREQSIGDGWRHVSCAYVIVKEAGSKPQYGTKIEAYVRRIRRVAICGVYKSAENSMENVTWPRSLLQRITELTQ